MATTAAMAAANATPSPTDPIRCTNSIVATIAPGPARSGVPSGTNATFAWALSSSAGSADFPVSSSSATSSSKGDEHFPEELRVRGELTHPVLTAAPVAPASSALSSCAVVDSQPIRSPVSCP